MYGHNLHSAKSYQEETEEEVEIHIGEDEIKATNEEMFEYYKKHGNLNYYYYLEESTNWKKAIDDMTLMFYEKLNQSKEKKIIIEDDVKVFDEINYSNQLNTPSASFKKMRKPTDAVINRKVSENLITRHDKKQKNNFEKTCLDFDDSTVTMEMPKEFVKDKHEDLMNSLAEDLMRSRRAAYLNNNSNYMIKYDDFNLLLCLMRNKKRDQFEKNPYYVNYHLEIEDVYLNEKDVEDENNPEKNVKDDIDNFVKMFTDRDFF